MTVIALPLPTLPVELRDAEGHCPSPGPQEQTTLLLLVSEAWGPN